MVKNERSTKSAVAIWMVLVLTLCPLLTINCGGGEDGGSPEGKLKWTETQAFVCSYSQERSEDEAYEVTLGGKLENTARETVEVFSVIIRLYNSAGGVVNDEINDRAWSPQFSPTQHYTSSFTRYYAQEVVRYDVLVTDSGGKEYVCGKG